MFDSVTDSANLVTIPVPSDKLAYSTTYYWHVRYQDNRGMWSAWSDETAFTTGADDLLPIPSDNAEGPLPVWISIAVVAGTAALAIAGASAFYAHALLAARTTGLSSADAISRRLRGRPKHH
jgi:hypothetical protein